MALKFLASYKSQIILGSAVTGVWLTYTWLPHTVGLSWYKEWHRFQQRKDENQDLSSSTLSLIEQVKADLKSHDINEHSFERCCFFKLNSLGPMFNKGTSKFKTGAIVGIPFTFELTLSQLVPTMRGVYSSDKTKIDWNSEAGQQFIKNIPLSDRAKKFAIAWQLNYVCSNYLLGKSFIGVSMFTMYFIQSKRIQMKLLQEDNLMRIFAKSQKVSDKAAGYKRTLTDLDRYKIIRAYNIYYQVCLAIGFVAAYHIVYYCYTWYMDKRMDRKTANLGADYIQGGIEFYGKFLERNKAERNLMDFGKKYYKENGDVVQGYVLSPYRPISKAKHFLAEMLNAAS